MEENKTNTEVTETNEKKISFSISASMLYVLIPLAILATFMLYSIITTFAGTTPVVHGIFGILFLTASLFSLGLDVIKFRTLNLEVALSMLVVLVMFLRF